MFNKAFIAPLELAYEDTLTVVVSIELNAIVVYCYLFH